MSTKSTRLARVLRELGLTARTGDGIAESADLEAQVSALERLRQRAAERRQRYAALVTTGEPK